MVATGRVPSALASCEQTPLPTGARPGGLLVSSQTCVASSVELDCLCDFLEYWGGTWTLDWRVDGL